MKIPRFGREGNPYWRCILLFQRKFLDAEAGPIRLADIAAGLMKKARHAQAALTQVQFDRRDLVTRPAPRDHDI